MKVLLLDPEHDFEPAPALRDDVFAAMVSESMTELARVRQEHARAHSGRTPPLPPLEEMRAQDLELETLWAAMSAGDDFVLEAVRRIVLSSVSDPDVIRYRQAILVDCLRHPDVVRRVYELSLEVLTSVRRAGPVRGGAGAVSVLRRALDLLRQHLTTLRRLRRVADEHAGGFTSPGLSRFFGRLREELTDGYLDRAEQTLADLDFEREVIASAGLTIRDEAAAFTVHRPPAEAQRGWSGRLTGSRRAAHDLVIDIDPTDDDGVQELEWLRGRAIEQVADVVDGAAEHIRRFMTTLRLELAFYLGAVNLRAQLGSAGDAVCFPEPLPAEASGLQAEGLRDVCLTLRVGAGVVGNDIDADGKALIVITGANHGGKSTALRSLGTAQLMLQCGLFVTARRFRASPCSGLYTHYRREEDTAMDSGKLGEELGRMRAITDAIGAGSLLLCNESFAATNEREGSEIARQIVRAMLDSGIRVIFVTHLYDFAHGFYAEARPDALFLRAEPDPGGNRTYKLLEREPLATSYGRDAYRRVFPERR